MRARHWTILAAGAAVMGGGAPCGATDLSWSGFASFYGIAPLQRDIFLDEPEQTGGRLTFTDGSRLGLNIRADLGEGWSAIVQLLASGSHYPALHEEPDWKPRADWFYVVYNPVEGLYLRVGRQIFPNWLASEFIDVGFTYPWRRPPDAVYRVAQFKSFNGVSADYRLDVGGGAGLTASVFGGNEKITKVFGQAASASIEINNLFGGTLTLDGDGWRVKAMASRFQGSVSVDAGVVAVSGPLGQTLLSRVTAGLVTNYTVGARYDKSGIVAYGEFGAGKAYDAEIIADTGMPLLDHQIGGYGAGGYRFGKWLPWYMFALADWRLGFGGMNGVIRSHSLGLDYQATTFAVVKAQYDRTYCEDGFEGLSGPGTADTVSLGIDVVF